MLDDLFYVGLGVAGSGALGALTWLGKRQWQAIQLAREGIVFPIQRGDDGKRVMHVRASLDMVPFGRNPETTRGYTHIGDVLSVTLLAQHFDDRPVRFEFDYFSEIRPSMKNVVLLGLSSRSPGSKEISKDLYARGIRVRSENSHAFFRDSGGTAYRCAEEECMIDGQRHLIVTEDCGVIVRRVLDSGTVVTILGGIHTQGTYAATQIALSREFQQRVRKRRLKEFIQFVTVEGITSGPTAGTGIHNIRWKELPLESLENYPIRAVE